MITIIIATYNASLVLQKTLNSIRMQETNNYELIIIDGKSKDNTVDIIKENDDIVFNWISEPDNGLYDAWNKAIKLSRGKWICFLGAGDILVHDALLKYEEFINQINEPCDYISAKVNRVDSAGNILSIMGKEWNWNEFKNSMTVAHVGSLHNRSLFEEIGFYNTGYKICADYELLLRKRDRLKSLFMDYVIADMPIGGTSFSVSALKESTKAKYFTGRQSTFMVFFIFIYQLILFKTYSLRKKW